LRCVNILARWRTDSSATIGRGDHHAFTLLPLVCNA